MQVSGSNVLKIWDLTKNSDSLSTLGCIYLTFKPLTYYLLLQRITDKKGYEEKDGFYSDICFLIVHDSTQRICLLSQFSFFIFPVHVFFYFPPLSRLPVQPVHKIVTTVNSFEVYKSKKRVNYTPICISLAYT